MMRVQRNPVFWCLGILYLLLATQLGGLLTVAAPHTICDDDCPREMDSAAAAQLAGPNVNPAGAKPTATRTPTRTYTPTRTPSPSATASASPTPTRTSSLSATSTVSPTPTRTRTPAITATPTPTATPTLLPASIGDTVWNDCNGNGRQDDGPGTGFNGVTLRLYRDDGNATFEPGAGDLLVATTITTGDDGYLFAGLAPSPYWVDVDENSPALAGWTFFPSPHSGPEPFLAQISAGDAFTAADFSYVGRGIIWGTVFYDWDGDGFQGLGEDGIAAVDVCLYRDANWDGQWDAGDLYLECCVTDSQGSYAFSGLLPGRYLLVENQPTMLDSTTTNILAIELIIYGPSGSMGALNFGDIQHTRLGGVVYVDLNGNGLRDPSETTGLPGVSLQVTGADLLGRQVGLTITTTDGSYLAANLLPGEYAVTAPSTLNGYIPTSANSRTATLTLSAPEDLSLDFGYIAPTGEGIYGFRATASPGQILLFWIASTSERPAFHVWRADNSKTVGAVRLNATPVTGESGVYRFADRTMTPGQTYWYWLENTAGGQRYGPQTVTAPQASGPVYLPLIRR